MEKKERPERNDGKTLDNKHDKSKGTSLGSTCARDPIKWKVKLDDAKKIKVLSSHAK